MADPSRTFSSRRALLVGVMGGLAATTASMLGRPLRADAADGNPVVLGALNFATASTVIMSTAANGSAFEARGSGTGTGVTALSTTGYGVFGTSDSGSVPSVLGWSTGGNTGLHGHSGGGDLPTSPAKTGVYGYAAQDSNARGVTGETTVGRGVQGIATSGAGVFGISPSGWGVYASSTSGTGIYASSDSGTGADVASGTGTAVIAGSGTGTGVDASSDTGTAVKGVTTSGEGVHAESNGTGLALRAVGRVKFSTARLTVVTVGANMATVTPGVDLVVGSTILCTLESNQVGLAIQRITKNTTTNTFKVYLSTTLKPGKTAKIGSFVIG